MSRLLQTAVAIGAAVATWAAGEALVRLLVRDRFDRYSARAAIRYAVSIALVVVILFIWKAFSGSSAVVVGLIAAGLTFAMQEVVGAVAGWMNVLAGRVYRVGDRIEIGGVQGDVIDITPLRTKLMEIGSQRQDEAGGSDSSPSWVKGRQTTGRIVTFSNKQTFTDPVFNYSAAFDFVWEELTLPIPYRDDWHRAEEILLDEARKASRSEGAQKAMDEMSQRYPVPRTEVEPQVYVRATDNWVELSARFVVPVRTARTVRAELTRRLLERLAAEGLEVASETAELTIFEDGAGPAKT